MAMSDEVRLTASQRYEELKRLLGQYSAFISDLPVKPQRAGDLGPAFEKCVLEARFIFPGLSIQEQELIGLVRLAGMNILARYLMMRVSEEGLARCGLKVESKEDLDRVTSGLEANFVECKRQIMNRGVPNQFTEVQKLFWEEWSNPLQGVRS